MENSRRRQLHSCDPCRKGKRGCDATVVNIALPYRRQILTSRFRKTEMIVTLVLAPTANDGRRSARSIGSPRSVRNPREVGEEQNPALQVHLKLVIFLPL